MPDWLSKDTLDAWWRILTAAPQLSVALVLVCLIIGYSAARWRYAAKIDGLEERLKLRDDTVADYKRKLDGATPDEAKQRIAALERLVAPMKPRDLTDKQALILTRHLTPLAPRNVEVGYAHGDAVCQDYADRMSEVIRGAGWRVQVNSILAPFRRGIGLHVVASAAGPTPEAAAIMAALNEAEIAFVPTENSLPDDLVCRLVIGPSA